MISAVRFAALLLVPTALLGSLGYVAVTHTHERPARPAAFAVESCDADAGPKLAKIRLGTLTTRHSSLVDVVEGRAASPELPGGSVFVASAPNDRGINRPTLYEWDVSRARAMFTTEIKFENDKVDTGNPSATRIATGGKYVYVVTELDHAQHIQLDAFERDGKPRGRAWLDGAGSEASVAAAESWVAVAYRPAVHAKTEVHLFSTPTARWPDIGKRELDTDRLAKGQRPAVLAFVSDRLFVAEQPSPTETRVSELALPSLKTLKTYSVRHARTTPLGRSELTGRNENRRLFLLDHGTLITLTLDLAEEGRTTLASDEVAIGPAGEILTTTGLGTPGARGDFVAVMDREAACTPAWSGQIPVLACAVDMEGALIARFPALPPQPWALPQSAATP
ncbi:MAG TPA: hypothetical protein VLT33_35180 [Labilithrix sp.]|nr:hypothetical protein [Labilithrix sp.]